MMAATTTTSTPFAQMRRSMRLVVDEEEGKGEEVAAIESRPPNDLSYVYSGYAPVTCRIVEALHRAREKPWPARTMLSKGGSLATLSAPSSYSYSTSASASTSSSSSTQHHKQAAWRGLEDVLKTIPGGPTFEEIQRPPTGVDWPGDDGSIRDAGPGSASASASASSSSSSKTTVVVFLGGCTAAEVSALRFLSQHEEGRCIRGGRGEF